MAAAIPKGTFKIANCKIPTIQTEAIKVCSFVINPGYYMSMVQINAVGFDGFSCSLVRFRNADSNYIFSKHDLSTSGNYAPKIYILRNGNLFDLYVSGTYTSLYSYGGITVIATDDMVSFDNTGQIVSVDSIKDSATLLS